MESPSTCSPSHTPVVRSHGSVNVQTLGEGDLREVLRASAQALVNDSAVWRPLLKVRSVVLLESERMNERQALLP